MGLFWPKYPQDVKDGDEPSHSPTKNDRTLLGTERGTDKARRLETDTDRNLYTKIAGDDRADTLLYTAALSTIAASTPTAFVAFTASSAVKVYRVLISGSGYTDFNLRHNGSSIGEKFTNIEMQVEFVFDKGFNLSATDTLDAVVEHFVPGKTKDFKIFVYGE